MKQKIKNFINLFRNRLILIGLDQTRSTAIFQIFQETLTHIARHANATQVAVMLMGKPAELELEVCDNGKGITEKEISDPKSFGLMGIRGRVHSLGGIVSIGGTEKKGTTVKVQIPKDSKEPNSAKDSCSR